MYIRPRPSPRRFIWHQDIRVAHCQYSAMLIVFTQYSFCNSFRHGLICSPPLCFKHARRKMCHPPKFDDGVEHKKKLLKNLFSNIFLKNFKLP